MQVAPQVEDVLVPVRVASLEDVKTRCQLHQAKGLLLYPSPVLVQHSPRDDDVIDHGDKALSPKGIGERARVASAKIELAVCLKLRTLGRNEAVDDEVMTDQVSFDTGALLEP